MRLKPEAKRIEPQAEIFVQAERLGTAHAVLAARSAIASKPDDILVIFADTPLITPQTLSRMRAALARRAQQSSSWAFARPIPPATAGW